MRLNIICYFMLCGVTLLSLVGCASYSLVPARITVTELATGEPAAGVPVYLAWGRPNVLNPVSAQLHFTGADGAVSLRMPRFNDYKSDGPLVLDVGGEVVHHPGARLSRSYMFEVPSELLEFGGSAISIATPYPPHPPKYDVHIASQR
jgi:hypothetical protein